MGGRTWYTYLQNAPTLQRPYLTTVNPLPGGFVSPDPSYTPNVGFMAGGNATRTPSALTPGVASSRNTQHRFGPSPAGPGLRQLAPVVTTMGRFDMSILLRTVLGGRTPLLARAHEANLTKAAISMCGAPICRRSFINHLTCVLIAPPDGARKLGAVPLGKATRTFAKRCDSTCAGYFTTTFLTGQVEGDHVSPTRDELLAALGASSAVDLTRVCSEEDASSPAGKDTLQDEDLWADIPASTQMTVGDLSVEQWADEINKACEYHETDAQLTLDSARRMGAVNLLSPRTLGLLPENIIHGNTLAPAFAADLGLDKKESVMATYIVQVIKLIQWLFHRDKEPLHVTLSPLPGHGRSVSGGRVSKGKAVRRSDAGARYAWPLPPRRMQYTETTSGTAAVSILHGAPAGVVLGMSSVGRAAQAAQAAGAADAASAPSTRGHQYVPAYLTQLNDGTTSHCGGQASDEHTVEARTPPPLDDVEESFLTAALAHEAATYPSHDALTQWEDLTNRGILAVSWRQKSGPRSGPADGSPTRPTGCAGFSGDFAPTAVRCTVWFRRLVVAAAWMLETKRLGTWPNDFLSTFMATASLLRANKYLFLLSRR